MEQEEIDATGETREMELGMQPKDPDIVFHLIQESSIKSRELGFSTVIEIARHPSPELNQILEGGIMELVISQLVPNNGEIIGVICSALRNLAVSSPDRFEANLDSIPYEFLLSLPSSTDIIDFFYIGATNSNEFIAHIAPLAPQLASCFAAWLQDPKEASCHSALGLIFALALFSLECEVFPIDFQMIKPCLDASMSPRNRALTARILYLIEKDPQYIFFILSILSETDFKGMPAEQPNDLFEVIHDCICDKSLLELFKSNEVLNPLLEHVCGAVQADFERAIVVLGDIAVYLISDSSKRLELLSLLFSQENIYFERADAIFRILNTDPSIQLTPEQIILITRNYVLPDSNPHMSCLQAILEHTPQVLYEQVIQEILVSGFELKPNYAFQIFELILDHFKTPEHPLIPQIIAEMHAFVEENRADLDAMEDENGIKEQDKIQQFFQIFES